MEFAKIFSILLLLSGTTTITLSAIVFLGNKKNASNIIFGILAFFLGWWSISYYFWLSTDSYDAAKFWVGMLNVGATFIPVTYYHWVVILMGRKRKAILTFGYLITIIFSLFSFSKFYFTELAPIAGFSLWPKAGSLYIYYILILYVGFYLLSIIEIIYSIIKEKNHEKRNVNKIILAAFSISLAAGASNFPLWYGIEMLPYGNFLLFFVHVFLLSYAMVKYNLMNMKALYGQLITGLILVTAFVDIFLSDSVTETIQKIFTFSIIVAFSYLLIKSSRETVKQKEELEILSKKLAKNNRKLKELDDAKNE
ncbi:MAG: histidine kinase N-terminal 7TM domain-containing protein, partial [Candidatus Moranbacteria bacterium]|nr:histidine kinase N-terminal 7TM domain-containing protein [Candidatus Moranbacteria bacterium]